MKKLILTLWFFTLLSSTYTIPLFAYTKDIIPTSFSMILNINSDGSADGVIDISIQNDDASRFMTDYTISMPIINIVNTSVLIEGTPAHIETLNQTKGYQNLKILFDENFRRISGKPINIKVNFSSSKIFTITSKLQQVFIPEIFPNSSRSINKKIQIHISKEFGKLIYYNKQNLQLTENNEIFSFQNTTNNSILILFGSSEKFFVRSQFQIQPKENPNTKTLFNLFGTLENIQYELINVGDYGVYNQVGNNFGVLHNTYVDPLNVDIQAQMNFSTTSKFKENISYNLYTDVDSDFYLEIRQYFIQNISLEDKLKILNEKIKQQTKSNKILKVDWESGELIWQKFTTGMTALNSFEICYIQAGLASLFDIKVNIYYGYILYPDYPDFDITKPHVWCSFSNGNDEILMDTYLEDLTNIDYFNSKIQDRLAIGIAHPDFIYDPMLGLKSEESDVIHLQVSSSSDVLGVDNLTSSIKAKLLTQSPVYSGEFFSGVFEVYNPTSEFLIFNQIFVNGIEEISNLFLHKDLKYGLLPFRTNQISLNYLIERNIFFYGQKNISVDIKNDGIDLVNASAEVEFLQNTKSIYIFAITLVTILCISILFFNHKRKIKKIKLGN
jgi:hypothetical protein